MGMSVRVCANRKRVSACHGGFAHFKKCHKMGLIDEKESVQGLKIQGQISQFPPFRMWVWLGGLGRGQGQLGGAGQGAGSVVHDLIVEKALHIHHGG